MFRIYSFSLGPLLVALATFVLLYLLKRRRYTTEPPGPPGTIEHIRWRASQEYTEEAEG